MHLVGLPRKWSRECRGRHLVPRMLRRPCDLEQGTPAMRSRFDSVWGILKGRSVNREWECEWERFNYCSPSKSFCMVKSLVSNLRNGQKQFYECIEGIIQSVVAVETEHAKIHVGPTQSVFQHVEAYRNALWSGCLCRSTNHRKVIQNLLKSECL